MNIINLFDVVLFVIIITITSLVLYLLWQSTRFFYKRSLIENIQNRHLTSQSNSNKGDNYVLGSSVDNFNGKGNGNDNKDFLKQAKSAEYTIRSYKDREIIGDYTDYADYKKKQELMKKRQLEGNSDDSYIEYDDYPELIYKPLDIQKKPKIKDPEKFFKSSEPEIEYTKPWEQSKIDIAQIPNSEMCVKSISGQSYECGVPASNTYLYNDIL